MDAGWFVYRNSWDFKIEIILKIYDIKEKPDSGILLE